jgi:hypothetical protein
VLHEVGRDTETRAQVRCAPLAEPHELSGSIAVLSREQLSAETRIHLCYGLHTCPHVHLK